MPHTQPAPADFATLAPTMTLGQAKPHWHRGETTLRRWEIETGARLIRADRHRPMPDDFVPRHATMDVCSLARHYNACKTVVRRWSVEAGIARKHGETIRRPASVAFERQAPERPKPARTGKQKFSPVDRARIDTSSAGMAADFLRRFGPVVRTDAAGRFKGDGDHWRRGSRIMTAGDVVERARAMGFDPDEWKRVAA